MSEDLVRANIEAAEPRALRQQGHTNGGGATDQAPLMPRGLFWPALQQLPRPEWLVKGLIPVGGFLEIFGTFGAGKSFFTTDIGLHIALGLDWRGRRVRQGGVLYVAAEGGAGIINRLLAWQQHHATTLDDVAFAVVIQGTSLFESEGVDQVIADAAGVPDTVLIVIDTTSRVMPGSREDTEDMGKFVAACDRIREATGAAVIAVHHAGKDVKLGSRGSVVLPAAVDTMISVTGAGADGIHIAKIEKQRDGESGAALPFELEVVELGQDADGAPVTSCVPLPAEGAPAKARARQLNDRQRRALDVLHDVLADHGRPAPDAKHYPAGATVVTLDMWREHLFARGVLDREAKNPRSAFFNLKGQLAKKEAIAEWDPYIWAVEGRADVG